MLLYLNYFRITSFTKHSSDVLVSQFPSQGELLRILSQTDMTVIIHIYNFLSTIPENLNSIQYFSWLKVSSIEKENFECMRDGNVINILKNPLQINIYPTLKFHKK